MGRKSKLVWNWISEGQMWPLPGYQAFWLPLCFPVSCSILYRKQVGGKMGWVGGGEGREEVGGGSVFKSEVYAEKLCTTPLWCRLCRKGNHFSCWETFPHVNFKPHPPPCAFRFSIAHLDLSFISASFTFMMSLSIILFFLHFCPVMLEYYLLVLSDSLKKNKPDWGYCP